MGHPPLLPANQFLFYHSILFPVKTSPCDTQFPPSKSVISLCVFIFLCGSCTLSGSWDIMGISRCCGCRLPCSRCLCRWRCKPCLMLAWGRGHLEHHVALHPLWGEHFHFINKKPEPGMTHNMVSVSLKCFCVMLTHL